MTSPDEQPASDRRRVRPYAMTGGRTRPTHDDLAIEALVSTISTGEQTPKLTVEQRAIGALCHELLPIAEPRRSRQRSLPPPDAHRGRAAWSSARRLGVRTSPLRLTSRVIS